MYHLSICPEKAVWLAGHAIRIPASTISDLVKTASDPNPLISAPLAERNDLAKLGRDVAKTADTFLRISRKRAESRGSFSDLIRRASLVGIADQMGAEALSPGVGCLCRSR